MLNILDEKIAKMNFINIDVEGIELNVLKSLKFFRSTCVNH
tara:strand:+ start:432 stop:554 length:123 start_codon:yes stop_codon:yes gene_type:complete